jgi:hypothetical protein
MRVAYRISVPAFARACKDFTLILASIVAVSLPQMAMAQVSAQGGQAYGTFGYRNLGQSFTPSPSTFGGGIQVGAGGNFLYAGRTNGPSAFATPWRQVDTNVLSIANGLAPRVDTTLLGSTNGFVVPAQPAAAAPQAPALAANPPLPPLGPDVAGTGLPETNAPQPTSPPQLRPDIRPGMPQVTPMRQQTSTRSADLSDLMTRTARTKGMLVGGGIDVYVNEKVARMSGTVRTPHDRALLATLLALEPGVAQVDNQLVVEGAGRPSSK